MESLRRVEAALAALPVGIVGIDDSGIVHWANRACGDVLGRPPHEILGEGLLEILVLHQDGKPIWYAGHPVVIALEERTTGSGIYTLVRREDRVIVEISWTGIVRGTAHTSAVFVVRDVTDQHHVTERLKESEERYRSLFANANDIIITTDLTGRFTAMNRAGEDAVGYSEKEILGRNVAELIAPEHVRTLRKMRWNELRGGPGMTWEVDVVCRKGDRVPVEMSAQLIGTQEKPVGFQGIARDVRERKRLEADLQQAQRLEAIGGLAAGIAHEINTPTQYIGDNLAFIQQALPRLFDTLNACMDVTKQLEAVPGAAPHVEALLKVLCAEQAEFLKAELPPAVEQALEGVRRVATIVRAMKEFAHPIAASRELINIHEAIRTTITVARNEWKYVAEVKTEFDLELPEIPCFPGEFNQVVLNLIVNAAHAIADVQRERGGAMGTITIRTARDGDWVEVQVADTGSGIPEDVRGRIFDPFFTTKAVGKGTGQGLAIAYGAVVKKHQGTISFETEVGKGTTFIVRLPLNTDDGADSNRVGRR